jgi:hypothetical protein
MFGHGGPMSAGAWVGAALRSVDVLLLAVVVFWIQCHSS